MDSRFSRFTRTGDWIMTIHEDLMDRPCDPRTEHEEGTQVWTYLPGFHGACVLVVLVCKSEVPNCWIASVSEEWARRQAKIKAAIESLRQVE